MDTIRLATIGSGSIVHSILDQVAITNGITCVAVYSRNTQTASALATQYKIPKRFTNLSDMLDDPQIDLVYVASPNSLHYEQTKAALLAGKSVLCEKPFCTRADQARELRQISIEKGLYLIEAVPTAYLPNFTLIRDQLPKLGRLRLVIANYTQYSSRYDQLRLGNVTNVFNPEYGGGCLQDINYYNVYLNVLLFGKPIDVCYYPNVAATGVDTSGVMVLQYSDFISTNTGSKDARGINLFQIEGEDGFLYIPGGSNGLTSLRVVTQTTDETFNAQLNPNRWFYEIQNLVLLLQNGERKVFDRHLDTTITVVETIEAARKKAGILFPGDSQI